MLLLWQSNAYSLMALKKSIVPHCFIKCPCHIWLSGNILNSCHNSAAYVLSFIQQAVWKRIQIPKHSGSKQKPPAPGEKSTMKTERSRKEFALRADVQGEVDITSGPYLWCQHPLVLSMLRMTEPGGGGFGGRLAAEKWTKLGRKNVPTPHSCWYD